VAKDEVVVDRFLAALTDRRFEFTKEEGMFEYLGIKMTRNDSTGTFTLTQTGLIEKIATVTGLTASNGNRVPAAQVALGSDPNGEPMKESWNCALVVGMLLYLSTNTCPDIAYAVSQVAQFTSNPKQSHATPVKMIVRYLVSTKLFGTIMRPYCFDLDLYVDADFVSLFRREPDENPDSLWSRTGLILLFCGLPHALEVLPTNRDLHVDPGSQVLGSLECTQDPTPSQADHHRGP
jgi:hypothetical protein